jgi:50S ribosomal protein L16 3-hydroxylase
MTREFLFGMAESAWPDARYADPGRKPTRTPAAIDPALLDAIADRITRLRFTPQDVEDFVGRHFSEPKAHVYFDPPDAASPAAFARRAARRGVVCDPGAAMLYRGRRVYVAGEVFDLPSPGAAAFRLLADRRGLNAAEVARLVANEASRALLHQWWQHGWISIDDGAFDVAC